MEELNNLELWNRVNVTDPKRTKKQTHGAKLTSIDAYSQIEQATSIWGSMGIGWGFRDVEITIHGEFPNQLMLFMAEFYYPSGAFPALNSYALSPETKYGSAIVSDCVKRTMTDTLTKCLSYLGFSADVFMGKFDNKDYVAEMNEKFHNNPPSPPPQPQPSQPKFTSVTKEQEADFLRLLEYLTADYNSSETAKTKILEDCGVTETKQISAVKFSEVWDKHKLNVVKFEEQTGGK